MKILDVPQSGSLAGQTSSRNRFGQYRRTRAVPVNPNSSAQQAVRNYLTSSALAWRGLTNAEREAWTSYAGGHPRVNSLGQSITLTGFQFYVSVNQVLLSAGHAAVNTVPNDAVVVAPVLSGIVSTAAGLNIDNTDAYTNAEQVTAESSPPLSQGVSFNKDFRLVATSAAPAGADPLVTAAQMTAKWGSLTAGQKFFFRFRAVDALGNFSDYSTTSLVLT